MESLGEEVEVVGSGKVEGGCLGEGAEMDTRGMKHWAVEEQVGRGWCD